MTPARAVVGARAGANPAPGAPPPREAPGSADLRDDLEGLALRLRAAIHREDRLDAFLFAAGMLQIAEDALDCEPELLLHVARRLGAAPGVGARAGAASARMVARAAGAIAEQHVDPGMRRWTAQLAALVQRLAEGVADPARPMPARSCDAVLDGVHRLPATLRRTAMRRPACFGIFDQHPDDVRELTARFARFAPARRRPLLVLGVRTSGSYLAPLTGAFLRARGYADVTVLTLRPGRRQRAGQRRAMQAVARRGGLALVCDDPPGSGRTVAGVADLLAAGGLDVVLVLAVFGPPRALPRDLAGRPAVLLGQADWAVTARLAPTAVGATVADLLGPAIEIVACERLDGGAPRRVRRHVRAAYRLTVRDRGHRDTTEAWIAVEGVGLGHLGADAAVLHRELEPYLAPLLGVRDGLMYREWLPDRARADRRTPEPARTAQRLAGYVDARARALPLASDRTTGARGERPAWEAASLVLSRAFGRAQPA
ncbi:MAG: hypothetical protein QOF86_3395, partial [Baekduia sp.]|nr:hypothetical protein [Baekduia sp.]